MLQSAIFGFFLQQPTRHIKDRLIEFVVQFNHGIEGFAACIERRVPLNPRWQWADICSRQREQCNSDRDDKTCQCRDEGCTQPNEEHP